MKKAIAAALALAAVVATLAPAASEELRIGTVKLGAAGPVFIAEAKGYYKAHGIDAHLVYFDSPGAVPVAVASGDVDIASTGSSAEIYTLAAQGAFKIIASQAHEAPGFRINAFVVSNRAMAAGLKSYRDLPGHTIGVSVFGGPTEYAAALLLEKYKVGLASVRFVALQSNPNVLSAVVGGTVDTAVLPAMSVVPTAERGALKVLGWIGDETPWQSSAVFASAKLLASDPDLVRRFLAAFRDAEHDFHDAFTAPDGSRRDMATAPEILAILGKYTGLTETQLRLSIPYSDRDGRLDFRDIAHQIAWFKSQNMLKGDIDLDSVLDRRFAEPLPGP
jgi:NitT/TauT family transport system substrate-binding protein